MKLINFHWGHSPNSIIFIDAWIIPIANHKPSTPIASWFTNHRADWNCLWHCTTDCSYCISTNMNNYVCGVCWHLWSLQLYNIWLHCTYIEIEFIFDVKCFFLIICLNEYIYLSLRKWDKPRYYSQISNEKYYCTTLHNLVRIYQVTPFTSIKLFSHTKYIKK